MRRALIALCVLGAGLAIAGCGNSGSDDEVATALGGSSSDAAALQDFFDTMSPLPQLSIELIRDFRQEDVVKARATVDQALDLIDEGQQQASDFDEPLRATLLDYLAETKDALTASEAVVAYSEKGGPSNPAKEAQLLANLKRESAGAQEADRQLLAKILAVVPDDADEQIRDYYRDIQEQVREAKASGGP